MSNHFTPRVGAVFSADIAVPEHERELRFYSRVLGTGDHPLWRDDLMNNMGIPVIGLGARTPEHADLPLQWMPHIQVADVATSAQRAVELGGRELMHAKGEDGASQWAVLADPNGAAFGIIPVVPAEALPPTDAASSAESTDTAADSADASRIGRIAWLDLTVPDATNTREFYKQVVGWSSQDLELQHDGDIYADYVMLGSDGNAAAGVCHARGQNAGLPPVWLIYLSVADMAESLRRVEEEGGTIIKAVQGKNGQYVYAAVRDPVGACFALAPV